jgi:hypothetical protein
VVVDVRLLAVIVGLVGRIVIVGVEERSVVVLVAVVMGAVLELAERPIGVVVRHVIVVVRVHLRWMGVLLLLRLIADRRLADGRARRLLGHDVLTS